MLANPWWLLLLLALPLIAWKRSRGSAQGIPLSTFRLFDSVDAKSPTRTRRLLIGFRVTAIALMVIGLARPVGEGAWIEEKRFGIDIMLALDLSGSMRAEDFQPDNRLVVAKRVLADFIRRNPDHRMGLVGFAGRSLTLCPLTTDSSALLQVVERLDFKTISQDGTAIGDAIGNSLYRLEDRSAKSRVIVLLSDGENNAGYLQPIQAAAMAKAKGIKIYTIAVGKPGGAPIPIVDEFGRKTYLRTRDGSVYLPPMDEAALRKIAQLTGGRYFRATDPAGLEKAYSAISKLERSEIPSARRRVVEERYGFPLMAGILLLLAEFLLGGVRRVLQVRTSHA